MALRLLFRIQQCFGSPWSSTCGWNKRLSSTSRNHGVVKKRRIPWRLLVGAGLVIASVAGVAVVIDRATSTTTLFQVVAQIPAGDTIDPADLQPIEIPTSSHLGAYLTPADEIEGLRTNIALSEGEFIPRSALTEELVSDDSVVTIELAIGLPDWLASGASVELWVAPSAGENAYREPFVLAPRVRIVRVRQDEGFAADTVTTRVDVLVPRRHLPGVVHALANRHFMVLSSHQGTSR